MRDKTAVFYFAAFVVFVALMILTIDISPKKLLSNAGAAGADASLAARINECYRRDFDFIATARTAGAYLPVYSKLSANDAAVYASAFGIYQPPTESENEFVFTGDGFTVTVDKYLSRIRYDATNSAAEKEISRDEALSAAANFPLNKLGGELGLAFSHEEAGGYLFTEQKTLDGLPFDGFSSSTLVSRLGEVIYCEIYLTEFEKIATRGLLSLEQACVKLPLPEGDARKISVKKAELRYILLDSIVQPVYIFEGRYDDGADFNAVIPALKYD